MLNKAFSQLTEAERLHKFDTVIRRNTDNLLTAEHIKALVKEIRLNCQYTVMVHPAEREGCEALVTGNELHIYIPVNSTITERKVKL